MHSRLLLAAILLTEFALSAEDWPQWLGPRRDSVWRESGIVDKFPAGGPKVRWRTAILSGYSGPAVAQGRVYVMDRELAPGVGNPENAFTKALIPGKERVLCLEETTGKTIWEYKYECPYTISYAAGPRATPTVWDGKVFTLGAEGNLHCLDAVTGKVRWHRDFKVDFAVRTPEWGFAGHPLVVGNQVICVAGGTNTLAVALDVTTGKEIWRSLSAKEPGYAPPTLIEQGGQRRVIIWHPESINALEPETGKPVWSFPFPVRFGLTIASPRLYGDRLFVTAFYDGSRMLQLGSGPPELLWKSTKASEKDTSCLHSIMSTPFLEEGHIYGVCSYGQLRCLKLDTGERLWETLAATTPEAETRWGNAFLIKHQDRFFLSNERGELIIAKLSPKGYQELSRTHLIDPTNRDPGRMVVWSHPAFANRHIFARNDRELVCASLAAE